MTERIPVSLELSLETLLFISESGATYSMMSDYITFQVTEDISAPFMRGYMEFHDGNAITEKGDAYSGGYLFVKFRTNEAADFFEKMFWIYKVGEDKAEEGMYQHIQRKMHFFFVSIECIQDVNERYSNYYENLKPHEIVEKVTKDMLQIKELEKVDVTQDKINLVTNYSWSPLDIINYCKKKSYSVSNSDTGYLFFENRKGFYYVSLSELIKQTPINHPEANPIRLDASSIDRNKDYSYVGKIIDYRTKVHTDYIQNYMAHRFGGSIHLVDIEDKKWQEKKKSLSAYLPETCNLGIKTVTSSIHDNDKAWHSAYYGNLPDYKLPPYMRFDLIEDNNILAVLPGNSNRFAGEIVFLNYPSKEKPYTTRNERLHGHCMVKRITHLIDYKKHYSQEILFVKDGLWKTSSPNLSTGWNNAI